MLLNLILGKNFPLLITRKSAEAKKFILLAKDATELYRKLLSKSPDSSVVIITIGHLTNFKNLLKSNGDRYSSLTVKNWPIEKFPNGYAWAVNFPDGKEANFYRPDPGSSILYIA